MTNSRRCILDIAFRRRRDFHRNVWKDSSRLGDTTWIFSLWRWQKPLFDCKFSAERSLSMPLYTIMKVGVLISRLFRLISHDPRVDFSEETTFVTVFDYILGEICWMVVIRFPFFVFSMPSRKICQLDVVCLILWTVPSTKFFSYLVRATLLKNLSVGRCWVQ